MKKLITILGQALVASALLFGLVRLIDSTPAWAIDPKTLESDYTPMQLSGVSSTLSSTWSVTGVGVSYKIFVSSIAGGTGNLFFSNSPGVSYHINWTTDTLKDFKTQVSTFIVASTSETFVPTNQIWWDDMHILGQNPQFVFSNLLANATLYFQIQYGVQRTK